MTGPRPSTRAAGPANAGAAALGGADGRAQSALDTVRQPEPGGPDQAELRDMALLTAHRAGDPRALETLLTGVQARLFGVCLRMCGDIDRAQDLCQESLVKIIQGLPAFAARSRLSTWMIRITMNVCLTDRRRGRLRKTVSLDAPTERGVWGNSTGSAGSGRPFVGTAGEGREPGAPDRVERGEARERLAAAFAMLDPQQRAILILRDGQDMDYGDIAVALDIPEGTVKSRLFRARVALREAMERSGG